MTKIGEKLLKKMETWSDEDCLSHFLLFLTRIKLSNELLQNKHGFVTHQVLHVTSGKHVMSSPLQELEWPMEPVTMPLDKKEVN